MKTVRERKEYARLIAKKKRDDRRLLLVDVVAVICDMLYDPYDSDHECHLMEIGVLDPNYREYDWEWSSS